MYLRKRAEVQALLLGDQVNLPKTWTSKDGRRHSIKDMDDEHLVHTIRLLIRVASLQRATAALDVLRATQASGYDDVDHAARQVYRQTWVDYTSPHYHAMLKEARRRRLRGVRKVDLSEYGESVDRTTMLLELRVECDRLGIERAFDSERTKGRDFPQVPEKEEDPS